jgi:hypothetical protein
MSEAKVVGATGVVCGADGDKAAMEAYLARHGAGQTKWFTPGELHDLDRDVRRGRIGRVVFAGLADLLVGIWEEEIEFEAWPAEVDIEFVEPAGDGAVQIVAASWRQWRGRHRRRQAVAGAVLSALVLAAAFVLCVVLAR